MKLTIETNIDNYYGIVAPDGMVGFIRMTSFKTPPFITICMYKTTCGNSYGYQSETLEGLITELLQCGFSVFCFEEQKDFTAFLNGQMFPGNQIHFNKLKVDCDKYYSTTSPKGEMGFITMASGRFIVRNIFGLTKGIIDTDYTYRYKTLEGLIKQLAQDGFQVRSFDTCNELMKHLAQ